MKRILYIANARIPTEKAHGVQIIKMCEAFARGGNSVVLAAPWRFNHIKADPFTYYGVRRNFLLIKLPSLDLVWFGRIGFLIQMATFSVVSFIYTVIKRPDVIYSRDELPLWLAGFFCNDVVWEAHMPRNNAIARSLARRAKKLVVISEGLKQFFIAAGVPAQKIVVAHDAVDLEMFKEEINREKVREKLKLPQNKSIVMYIGRLDSWKGVETLLEASRVLPQNIQVVIIGEGDNFTRFKNEYQNVIFTGSLPYRELPENQQAADVLIIPNSGKSEVSRLYTSPLKMFAHMASGVPIIASDLPSIREVLHEANAMLVPSDNPQAFADAIKEVIIERDEAFARAARAKDDVKKYTWDNRAKAIIDSI